MVQCDEELLYTIQPNERLLRVMRHWSLRSAYKRTMSRSSAWADGSELNPCVDRCSRHRWSQIPSLSISSILLLLICNFAVFLTFIIPRLVIVPIFVGFLGRRTLLVASYRGQLQTDRDSGKLRNCRDSVSNLKARAHINLRTPLWHRAGLNSSDNQLVSTICTLYVSIIMC